jgi:polyribonucleotide nucleotidyltransferase
MQKVINAINELTVEAGTKPSTWEAPAKNDALISALKEAIGPRLGEAFQVRDKLQRRDAISAIKKDVFEALAGRVAAEGWNPAELSKNSASWNTAPCVTRCWTPRSVSTAARWTPSARSP